MISGVTGRCIEPGYANVPKLNGGEIRLEPVKKRKCSILSLAQISLL